MNGGDEGVRLQRGAFFGRITRQRAAGQVTLTETCYEAKATLPEHTHASPTFFIPIAGTFAVIADGAAAEYGANGASYHAANAAHTVEVQTAGARAFNIELFDPRVLQHLHGSISLIGAVVRASIIPYLLTRLRAELDSRDAMSALAIEGLSLELSAAVGRLAGRELRSQSKHVKYLLSLLEHDPTVFDPVGCIASHYAVDPVALARSVREETGRSIGSLARIARIRASCARLAETDESVSVIAADLGFFDHAHFCRTFKQVTGMTPSAYRAGRLPQ